MSTTTTIDNALDVMKDSGYDDDQLAKIQSWHDNDRTVLVFENADLGHPALGHKIAMPWDEGDIPTHGPDHPSVGFGWRYVTHLVVEPAPAPAQDLGEV